MILYSEIVHDTFHFWLRESGIKSEISTDIGGARQTAQTGVGVTKVVFVDSRTEIYRRNAILLGGSESRNNEQGWIPDTGVSDVLHIQDLESTGSNAQWNQLRLLVDSVDRQYNAYWNGYVIDSWCGCNRDSPTVGSGPTGPGVAFDEGCTEHVLMDDVVLG